ncbi:MAG: hypothetical protein JWL58_1313 [Streptosporangiaceae bacterium]|jgi:hypothetical protein|nr:hypothetical protein [Streptosporangiaceae bacterium]
MNGTKRIPAAGEPERRDSTASGRSAKVSGRVRRAGLLVAALAVLGSGLAGCGGSDGSSSTSSSAPAVSGGGGATNGAQAVKYSQCMRSHGVPGFPDPVNGRVQLLVTKGGPVDPNSPQFQAAEKACKSLAPAGIGGAGQNPQQQSQMLKFVSCMRKNGVPDFPDPEGGKIMFTSGGKVDPNSPQFQAAQKACQKLLPGGFPGGNQ